ncbi:MAG: AraC family transcriptional regulator [Candidatus Cryptobacteroides sp.]
MIDIQQEVTPITKEDLFIILNHPNAKFDYPVHCHPEYEINLVMHTDGTRVVGDSEEKFGDFDLVMIGPNVGHVWKSDKETNHVITIQFSGEMLSFPILDKRLFLPIKQLLEDSVHGLSFSGPEAVRIKDEIIELTKLQGFHTATNFLNILNLLATASRKKLVSSNYDPESIVRSSKSRRIAKVCKYIDENISNEIRLGDVAAMVNMSESAFSHFFKKRTNLSFINYVNNQRIAKACNLLASTTLSASEICWECGFNNKSNFIRTFTRKKNMTPIEYRKSIAQLLIKY